MAGILFRRERPRSLEQLERPGHVEAECALPGEQRVAGSAGCDLGLERRVAGGLGEGERFAGVVGELLDLLSRPSPRASPRRPGASRHAPARGICW